MYLCFSFIFEYQELQTMTSNFVQHIIRNCVDISGDPELVKVDEVHRVLDQLLELNLDDQADTHIKSKLIVFLKNAVQKTLHS